MYNITRYVFSFNELFIALTILSRSASLHLLPLIYMSINALLNTLIVGIDYLPYSLINNTIPQYSI